DRSDGEAAQADTYAKQGDVVNVLPVDADPFQRIALHLGDPYAQLHLVGRIDADVADHLVGVAVDVLEGQPARVLGSHRRPRGARENDRVALIVEVDAVGRVDRVER